MAYVNIKKEGVPYRLIMGNHNRVTKASQLTEGATAITAETLSDTALAIYGGLSGSKDFARSATVTQFLDIRAIAMQRGIPMMAAEPLGKLDVLLDQRARKVDSAGPVLFRHPKLAGRLFIAAYFGGLDKEIDRESGLFKLLLSTAQDMERFYPSNPIRLRDLVAAERTEAAATFQRSQRKITPDINILFAPLHAGVITALEMNPDERRAAIVTDPNIDMYKPETLGRVHYVIYDSRRKRWTQTYFEDPNLKPKKRK